MLPLQDSGAKMQSIFVAMEAAMAALRILSTPDLPQQGWLTRSDSNCNSSPGGFAGTRAGVQVASPGQRAGLTTMQPSSRHGTRAY